MFFLIGGIQPRTITLGRSYHACPGCGTTGLTAKRIDSYLSLFFIPLFRVKKGAPYHECSGCGAEFPGDESLRDRGSPNSGGCGHCGKPLLPQFSYCPYCGRKI